MKIFGSTIIGLVMGHGRIMSPPGRSSLKSFRNDPAIAPFWDLIVPNYNDHQLFCGGFGVQMANDYKCGVCGDNYADVRPRDNELGGKYGSHGIIPRTYASGDLMDVEIQLTAHHQGYFQFKLCEMKAGAVSEDEACFDDDNSVLEFADGSTKYSVTDFKPESADKSGYWYQFQVKLPDIECDHCVLQWRYHTGNSWGSDESGTGIGFGYQEEFYGCADVEIISLSSDISSTTTSTTTSSAIKKTTLMTTDPVKTTTTAKNTSQKSTTENTSKGFCNDQKNGLYPHLTDCNLFYQCHQGNTYVKNCPEGLHFNPEYNWCDWPINVNCERV